MNRRNIAWIAMAFLGMALAAWPGQARTITDMAGRKVTIPDKITKVYAAQPYTNVLLYVVAPELMLGLQPGCLPFRDEDKRFLRREVLSLPWLEATQSPAGQNARVNLEAILRLKPDFALATGGMKLNLQKDEELFGRIHLPVVYVDLDRIADYPKAIEFLGRILGRESRAKRLSAYARRVFAQVEKMVAAIPLEKRVRVYYAGSADGLVTESEQSFHADAIRMAGGNIVHKGEIKTHVGMEKVNLEQVLLYNPEVIVSLEPEFATRAYRDPRWRKIKAVATRRIYTVPRSPFNWIDRPPSVMRIIGVPWLAHCFYPDRYRVDIRKEIQEFHRLFMGVRVTEADLNRWLP